jgi:hypothetical protein
LLLFVSAARPWHIVMPMSGNTMCVVGIYPPALFAGRILAV